MRRRGGAIAGTPRTMSTEAACEECCEEGSTAAVFVPIVSPSRLEQRQRGVVVAIVAADVVHPLSVFGIRLLERRVPIGVGGRADDCVAPDGTHHKVVNPDAVRPRKVVDAPLAVSDAHVTNARAAAREASERTPDDAVGIALAADVDRRLMSTRHTLRALAISSPAHRDEAFALAHALPRMCSGGSTLGPAHRITAKNTHCKAWCAPS